LQRRAECLVQQEQHRVFVAEDQGKAVGLVHVFERPSLEKGVEAVVQAIVVDAGFRRAGIGHALMRAAERWATARGLDSISLHTRDDRTDAHAFYQRGGFYKAATASLMRKGTKAV
jgi:ribosomal protein S18 acetylase RimI-like enzyme